MSAVTRAAAVVVVALVGVAVGARVQRQQDERRAERVDVAHRLQLIRTREDATATERRRCVERPWTPLDVVTAAMDMREAMWRAER